MNIAYTIAPGKGDTDLLLYEVAQHFIAKGLRVCGTTQINSERQTDHPCDMDVQVLPDGPILRISQNLGAGARGCRLDPEALERAVALVEADLQNDVDLLIVNKFGKHEADGRGFRTAIATAISKDIPVLVGTNTLNRGAFLEFVGSSAIELAPMGEAIQAWGLSCLICELGA